MNGSERLHRGIAAGLGLVLSAGVIAGCENMNRTQKGAVTGGVVGAGVGALFGKGKGALIGGAIGAVSGGLIGNYMDRQAEELRTVADTTRTDDGIIVTMKDKILFDVDKAEIKPASQAGLDTIARVLSKYPKTMITVAGHTDDTGRAEYNQQLSERRADAVKFALAERGVAGDRVTAMGFGAARPAATNETPEGRANNRRVELHIVPDDDLKAEAAKEDG